MANGGARPGAGRKAGGKNKATIQRELQAAHQVAAVHGVGRELASAVLERLMGDLERYKELAEGAASLLVPPCSLNTLTASERELAWSCSDSAAAERSPPSKAARCSRAPS